MVKSQMPISTQMTVLVGNLGFQSMTDQYKTPCKLKSPRSLIKFFIEQMWSLTLIAVIKTNRELDYIPIYLKVDMSCNFFLVATFF